MKKKTEFKSLNIAYKISITAIVTMVVINILSFIFVLLPIYSLVGDSSLSIVDKDNKLENTENTFNVVSGLTVVLFTISAVSGGYGLYQDVHKKSKK